MLAARWLDAAETEVATEWWTVEVAADALEELVGAQLTVPLIAAFAAGKALRPACLEQCFLALRLRPVQAQEFR